MAEQSGSLDARRRLEALRKHAAGLALSGGVAMSPAEVRDVLDRVLEALPAEPPPLWQHAVNECNEAHAALDQLGAPNTTRVRRVRGPDGDEDVALGLAARITGLQSLEIYPDIDADVDISGGLAHGFTSLEPPPSLVAERCDCDQAGNPDVAYHASDCVWRRAAERPEKD